MNSFFSQSKACPIIVLLADHRAITATTVPISAVNAWIRSFKGGRRIYG